jgi:flagellin
MSRINTNIPSVIAQRVLLHQDQLLQTSLNRLSTGYRINAGRDDPAGLIASENLRAEKTAIQAALTNVSRANNVVASAEGGLAEINSLLLELEDLIDRSANEAAISVEERNANQLQIDAILDSINRIANNTEFLSRKLLSGELAYSTSGISTGSATSYFQNVAINAAKIPNNGYRSVTVGVTQAAELAEVKYIGTQVSGTVTVQIAGNLGTETLTFASGTTLAGMLTAVNQSKELTGVSASISAAGGALNFNSTQYGATQFVSVKVLDDGGVSTFGDASHLSTGDAGDNKDYGRNASVTINGVAAVTDGLHASMRSQSLSVDVDLTAEFGTLAAGYTADRTFTITGGGANFWISPTISLTGLASLGVQGVGAGSLGDANIGYLASLATGQTNALATGNYSTAQAIVRAAQQDVSSLRGRLGAFQKNTLETTANSLRVTYENTAAAEANIRETEFASETSMLTRAQILVQSATNTLRLANAQPQTGLALRGYAPAPPLHGPPRGARYWRATPSLIPAPSKQRRQDPGHPLQQLARQSAFPHIAQRYMPGPPAETLDRLGQRPAHARVVDQTSHLEVQPETAHIHVRRAQHAPAVIHRHDLRVQHPGLVFEDPRARLHQLLVEAARRPQRDPRIRTRRQHQLHRNPPTARVNQGHAQSRPGHEVRRGDANRALRRRDRRKQNVVQRAHILIWTVGNICTIDSPGRDGCGKYSSPTMFSRAAYSQSSAKVRCTKSAAGPSMRMCVSYQGLRRRSRPRYSSPMFWLPRNATCPSMTAILR